ncbi:hypothetical protein OCOL_001198 [Ordospora colligata]|uniref:C2H2-type domain-containing protein n=1 Tax=Ordospora colligata OC4 TaxID=1354746 RepID=A0A0B2UCV2_9MICR|nr:uncharacterized protein M896_120880 [Ordospora colligata OC4]KHN68866.1 hypothetical protein M896_120880 [Ordospora colligata OC4]TBU13900.1 hypothetical protein CWI40_120880 [Ordospora colligata]TBU14089.1 hypothetical protein CWI41_120880 [Ordospora colligata]
MNESGEDLEQLLTEDVTNDADMQEKKTDTVMKKNRSVDFSQVLISQAEAASECRKEEIRRFSKVPVEVETLGGEPLVFMMWATESKPVHRKKQIECRKSTFDCEVCENVFDTSKKLETHVKMIHKKSDESAKTHICSVCGKGFDEGRKLALHSNYHKN